MTRQTQRWWPCLPGAVAIAAVLACGCDLRPAIAAAIAGMPEDPGPPDTGHAPPDAGRRPDAGRPRDGGPLDAGTDAPVGMDTGPDAPPVDACVPCVADDPCEVVAGCEPTCEVTTLPDGTSCPAGVCRAGSCTPVPPGCGDGMRVTSGPGREACDDGNNDPGDACDIDCTPTLLVISDPPAPGRASAPVGALDGNGMMLFVWVEQVPAPTTIPGAEPTLEIRAQRYTTTGLRVEMMMDSPFVLEAGIGLGEPLRPSVTGLASGWVVTWRSPTVEGADGQLGGIAYRPVPAAGWTLGPRRQANVAERLDQRDPRVARLDSGFVIVWTDGSDTVSDPGYGVRAQRFDAFGNATGSELTIPTRTNGDQSQPSVSAIGARWTVAWTDTSDGTPVVRARRYDGALALDAAEVTVTSTWGFAPVASRTDVGTWIGWIDRSTDADGDIVVAFLDDAAAATSLTDGAATARVDDGLALLGGDATTAIFGYRTDSLVQGLRLDTVGAIAFPPEIADLNTHLVGFRQRDLALLFTLNGLWVSWSDDSVSDSTAAVAYLLPGD